jgi:ABC-type uncharacterized transport system ATPase subunit
MPPLPPTDLAPVPQPRPPPVALDKLANRKRVVIVDHRYKHHSTTVAVDNVSFYIAEGEIFGIIGPNGAGKAPWLNVFLDFVFRIQGLSLFMALVPRTTAKNYVRSWASVSNRVPLPLCFKVGGALDLFASFYPDPLDPHDLLESLGISEKRTVQFRRLSRGQKQRLSIAFTLIRHPPAAGGMSAFEALVVMPSGSRTSIRHQNRGSKPLYISMRMVSSIPQQR